MRKSLLFFVWLLLAQLGALAQEDEKSQPKGLLIESANGPLITAYTTEKTLLDFSAEDLVNWKKQNWVVRAADITTGAYAAGQRSMLESPVIQLPALSSARARLNLYLKEWYEIESYHDKGLVQVSENGVTWETLAIVDGKSDWRTSVINLTSYAGKNIRLGFRLIADQSHQYQGWRIAKLTLKQEFLKHSGASSTRNANGNERTLGTARTFGIQSTLTGELVGAVDAQRFPRYIFTHVAVKEGGLPLLTLNKSNFFVREYVSDSTHHIDTISVVKDDDFLVYTPQGDTVLKPVDIVFLMDNSGSMGDEQDSVYSNVEKFLQQLDTVGFDYQLGLCRFGQGASNGIPLFHDNARFYTDHTEFLTAWNTVNTVDGGREPSWDALYESSIQYSFRPGAQKVFILITDEPITGSNIAYNIIKDRQIVIDQLLNVGVRTYTLVPSGTVFESDFGTIATATQGRSYNIFSSFNDILQDIGTEIRGTYTIRYKPTNPVFDGLTRTVEIKAHHNSEVLTLFGQYTPGAAPVILRTNHTLALHKYAHLDNVPIRIEVEALDWDSLYTNSVNLYYRTADTTASYSTLTMTQTNITIGDPSQGIPTRSVWEATIPAAHVLSPGLQYYLRASDGQATTTTPEFIDREGYPYSLAVLPNLPPVLNHTPIESADPKSPIVFTATAIDSTEQISKVYLYYAKEADNAFTLVEMQHVPGTNNYEYTLPALNINTLLNYFIVAVDNFNVSVFSGSETAPHSIAVGVPWGVPSSPTFHTIRFLSLGAYPATVTIDNAPLAAGDVIGVFYTDDNGVLKPAGSMTWPATSLVAYGDHPSTPEKDGFVTGEVFTFKIFRKQDASFFDAEHIIYNTSISLQTFQASRQSFIQELRAFSEHVIYLSQGQNLWSTYLAPKSSPFTDLLDPIASFVYSVEDSYGNTWVPGNTSNTLTQYLIGDGYKIYMDSAATLRVKGARIDPATVTVTLNNQGEGVLVGTPYSSPEDVEAVFPRFDQNVYIVDRYVTDEEGNLNVETYSPAWDINTWTNKNMEPGKGYRVYVFNTQSFTFPPANGPYGGFAAGARIASSNTSSHTAQPIASIDRYMHVLIPTHAWKEVPAEKSEVRAYNKSGKLLGKAFVSSEGTAIILDGTLVQEKALFDLRLWDNAMRIERPLHITKWAHGSNTYQNHAASVIGKVQEADEKALKSALKVFPNPVVTEMEIEFTIKEDNEVLIELYDTKHTMMRVLQERQQYPQGSHQLKIPKKGLAPGLYIIKITIGNAVETERLIIK